MKNFKLVTFALLGFAATSLVSCNAPKEEATDEAAEGKGFDAIWAEIAANAASDDGDDEVEAPPVAPPVT